MKNDISSLDLYYLVKELKVLEGSKIDRVYNPKSNPKELTIRCHVTGQGKSLLKALLPGLIFLDDSKDAADIQTGFGMMMRKYLEGSRIKAIEQKDFERVITLIIESRSGEECIIYFLILELFSKGNIIFCSEDLKILNVAEEQVWKDRSLKRNEIYKYPVSKTNTMHISKENFQTQVVNSGKESLVKSLAITLNLGGTYSEELCHNSNIDKNCKVESLTNKDFEELYKNLFLLLHKEPAANEIDGNIFPFKLESSSEGKMKTYPSFSEAIRENYDILRHKESKKSSNVNIDRIQNIIDEQIKMLDECQEKYLENQAKGELIYEKYSEVDEILNTLKDAKKKYSWNIIKEKLNESPKYKNIIKNIDEKNNCITIEMERQSSQ